MKIKRYIALTFFIFLYVCVVYAEIWKEDRSRHFIIFYKSAPRDFVTAVEESAEDYYDKITRNLGFVRYDSWSFDKRAKIYIYDDHQDYVQSGKYADWSNGVVSAKIKTIRTFPLAHGFFDSTLPHELGHIIFREFIGFKAKVPVWFEEGVAMHQEKARRWGANRVVRKAMADGNFIPVDKLNYVRLGKNTSKETLQIFYSESASFVNFMIERFGRYRFVRLCRKLKNGISFEDALREVYGRHNNLHTLNEMWINYVKSNKY